MAKWIASINPEIPLHLSRYFPNYQLDKPATPVATLERAYQIAKEYLKYVYLGNTGSTNDTRCPDCDERLIERNGYRTKVLVENECPKCGRKIGIQK